MAAFIELSEKGDARCCWMGETWRDGDKSQIPSFHGNMTCCNQGKIHCQRREVVPCRFSRGGGGGFWGNKSLYAKQTDVEALSFMVQTCSWTVQPKLGQQFVLPAGWHNERKHVKLLCSPSKKGKRGAGKLFYWSFKILCLNQAGSFHIWAGDDYQKGKNTVVLKKVVKFFCVSSGTSWILLPLGKWSGLMCKEYKKLKDKTVSLKWVSKMKVLFQMSFYWRIFQYHW